MSTIEKAAARLAAKSKAEDAETDAGSPLKGARGKEAGAADEKRSHNTLGQEHRRYEFATGARHCHIDLDALRERGFITPDMGRTPLAQQMRRIKRPLLMSIQRARNVEESGPPRNLIMVTSALPGEGKTFISINLAMSIAAELDRRVLLVDADLARRDISRQLGLDADKRGLSDLLQESSYLSEDGVLFSNIERLSLLPAGEQTDHVDELFASDMMVEVSRALAEADPARVVLFDTSPLLATTESSVLARRMGQTVVVVEAGRTPQAAVKEALSQLDGSDNVSLVLNKTTGGGGSYHYGYGDGYGERQGRHQVES